MLTSLPLQNGSDYLVRNTKLGVNIATRADSQFIAIARRRANPNRQSHSRSTLYMCMYSLNSSLTYTGGLTGRVGSRC